MKILLEVEFERLFDNLNSKVSYKHYWDQLVELYSQKDRHYHNLKHINDGLEQIINSFSLRSKKSDFNKMIFAWFYHDSIYSTGKIEYNSLCLVKDNEEKSSELACKVAGEIGLNKKLISKIEQLILLTKHDKEPRDFAGKLIIDIDLTILGQKKEIFDEYEQNIRKEYYWVPEDLYKTGRSQILQAFLKRRHIYYTPYFRNKYEQQARINLKHSLIKLSNGSGEIPT